MKKITSLLAILLMFVAVNASSTPDNTNTPDAPATTTMLSGVVTDAVTGEALAGAAVEIENTDIRVFTDLDGNFTIDHMQTGTYSIKVKYISYEEKSLQEVNLKQAKSNLSIQLDSK